MRSPWFVRASQSPKPHLRLFCFPYAAGGSIIYRQWPERMSREVEVIAVELPGRGGRIKEPAFRRLPPLIEALTETLGPLLDVDYAFFGHSMGAMIAFELA